MALSPGGHPGLGGRPFQLHLHVRGRPRLFQPPQPFHHGEVVSRFPGGLSTQPLPRPKTSSSYPREKPMNPLTPAAIICFASMLVTAALGGFIFWQYGQRRIARIFALYSVFNGFWIFVAFLFYGAFPEQTVRYYYRLFFWSAPLDISAFFHLMMVLCRAETRWNQGL